MEIWHTDPSIPIIAQREFIEYNEYRERLSPFFARRAAIWSRQPIPGPSEIPPFEPVVPSITFADEYNYELGGVHFIMVHTPGETPDHATIWIPELGAVFVGDNYYEYFINNATLRGTSTRPVLGYIHALDLALSYHPTYFLMGHGTPIVSQNVVQQTVANFCDVLQYIYDETIRGINAGKDVHTLMQEIKVPDQYQIRPFFGKVEWTVRGIYHENIGWFDENPASMYALPASCVYSDIVDIAGVDALTKRAEQQLEQGEYVKVLHLTDIVLQSNPNHQMTNEIRLKTLEALKAGTRNYIERIWLDYGIRTAKERITERNIINKDR
jgi:alkyl sulfatase BDS1-like metallo-beta-lactamase superfamily hydrolase